MSDDLTTKEAETPDEEIDGEIEYTTREEYILCAVNAMNAVAEIDPMEKSGISRKNRIIRKCLRIIDDMVGEMYDELFSEDEEN